MNTTNTSASVDRIAGPSNALDTAFPSPPVTELAALRARLAIDADRAGLLDVAYRIVDSPFGALLVAATTVGVARIAFDREDHDAVLASLADAISPRILRSAQRTDAVARELDEYFAGRRRAFDVALDLRLVHGFRHTVIGLLRDIDYGRTASYASVARAAGNPKAVRAVGTACAHNPIPVVIPCHRVVRSDGTIGQYLGGVEVKAALLEMEAAA
ncbi:MAG: methylated-DNA--[protein]-cysteine S-methyltransferase [Ilumatobacteraceae bacterium]